MQTPRRVQAAPRDAAAPTGQGSAARRAPDETGTPEERLTSLWRTWQSADGGDDGGGGGAGGEGANLEVCPHSAAGLRRAKVEGDGWSGGRRGEARGHQMMILRRRRRI